MKKYLPYIKKYWYNFLLGPLFMILEAAGEFILPFLNKNVIDQGVARGDYGYVLKMGALMALVAILMLVTGVLGANFAIRGAARLAAGVRSVTFKKIQKFSFLEIDDFTTGSLITRLTNDVTQIQNFTQTLLRGMFRSPVMLIGAIVMSFILAPDVAWVIMIVVPVLAGIIALIICIAAPRYTAMQKQLDELNINIRESIVNGKVIKSFVREDYQNEKFDGVNKSLVDRSIKALRMMILLQPVSSLAVNVTTLAVVWVAGRKIMVGGMEIGTLTAFITYLSQILTALNFLANIVLQGTRAAASDRRISEVYNAQVSLDDSLAENDEMPESGSVEFKNVTFRYFKNNTEAVLDNICFKINSGETVGIVGSTGSGKTTLVSLISRLYDADCGEVLVDGKNVKTWKLTKLRDAVSVVLQKNTLFAGSVAENLRWGNKNATEEEIISAAKIAQADEFVSKFEGGYGYEIGQGGSNLSGGQRQRLCIARALLKKPKILILDDSTSAVDTATDRKIREGLRNYLPDTTKIIICQRINSIMEADKIICLEEGKIAGIGTHDELIKACESYREIYYSQNEGEGSED